MAESRCIVCGVPRENLMGNDGFQPMDGLAFATKGHYGSTYFDPMDGSALEVVVCDDCLAQADKRGVVYHHHVSPPKE